MLPHESGLVASIEQSGGDVDLFIVRVIGPLFDMIADGGAVLTVGPIQGLHYRSHAPSPIILTSANGTDGIASVDYAQVPRSCWVPLNMIGGGTIDNHIGKMFVAIDVGGLLFAIWPYTGTHIVS